MTDRERNAYHSQKQGKHGGLEAVARKIGSIQLLPFSSFDDSDLVRNSHSQKPFRGEKEEWSTDVFFLLAAKQKRQFNNTILYNEDKQVWSAN